MRRRLLAAAAFLGSLPFLSPAWAVAIDQPVELGRVVKCGECGMSAKVANRFTAQINQGASTLYFCDIGDMVAFIGRTQPKEYAASVHDFKTGKWIEASTAFFVVDKKVFSTPMGWGIAAFGDRAEATGAPLDFPALLKGLR